jgi:hypothetical protein
LFGRRVLHGVLLVIGQARTPTQDMIGDVTVTDKPDLRVSG